MPGVAGPRTLGRTEVRHGFVHHAFFALDKHPLEDGDLVVAAAMRPRVQGNVGPHGVQRGGVQHVKRHVLQRTLRHRSGYALPEIGGQSHFGGPVAQVRPHRGRGRGRNGKVSVHHGEVWANGDLGGFIVCIKSALLHTCAQMRVGKCASTRATPSFRR